MSRFGEPKPVERIKVLPQKTIRKVASKHFKSSQSLVKWAFASLFFALWYYFGTKVSCAGIEK